jgi:hypothetical protein
MTHFNIRGQGPWKARDFQPPILYKTKKTGTCMTTDIKTPMKIFFTAFVIDEKRAFDRGGKRGWGLDMGRSAKSLLHYRGKGEEEGGERLQTEPFFHETVTEEGTSGRAPRRPGSPAGFQPGKPRWRDSNNPWNAVVKANRGLASHCSGKP